MSPDRHVREPPERSARAAMAFAAIMSLTAWPALAIEFVASIGDSIDRGRSLGEAFFLFFHFFSILTNLGLAILMSLTAARLVRGRPMFAPLIYNSALIYILVTGITYELLLRRLYSPHDLRAITNAIIHDVMPLAMLAFWIALAPRRGARWRDVFWMLAYPAAYLGLTLVAGAYGEPYPYSFLDVDVLGGPRVALVATGFLVAFGGLGLMTTAVCRATDPVRDDRSPVV